MTAQRLAQREGFPIVNANRLVVAANPKTSEGECLEKGKNANSDVRKDTGPLCDAVGRGFLGRWHLRHLFLPVGVWRPWGSEHPDSDFKRALSAAKRFGQTEERR
jgi:hypothetical protein